MGTILFKIGGLSFYTHGFFLVVGVILSALVMYWLVKRSRGNTEAVFDLAVFSLLAGIIFARLTYFIIYRDQFYNWTDVFKIWQGGLVSWGGFVAGIACFLLIVKIYKENPSPWLDVLSVSALLGISVGRIGSFLSGELAGKASNNFLAIKGAYPVTLIEAAIMFLMFLLFIFILIRRNVESDGRFFLLVVLGYSFVRFLLDFLRVDQIIWLGLTYSQIISSVIIIIIVLYFAWRLWSKKKGTSHA